MPSSGFCFFLKKYKLHPQANYAKKHDLLYVVLGIVLQPLFFLACFFPFSFLSFSRSSWWNLSAVSQPHLHVCPAVVRQQQQERLQLTRPEQNRTKYGEDFLILVWAHEYSKISNQLQKKVTLSFQPTTDFKTVPEDIRWKQNFEILTAVLFSD